MNTLKNENIDADTWNVLVESSQNACQKSYAPYSKFHVGAAALTEKGVVVQGCNVENASYGLTVCAERNCIAQAVIASETKLARMAIYTKEEQLTPPCGACRQVIAEFFSQDAQIMAVNHLNKFKVWTVAQLLPDAFTPQNLLDR